MPPNHLGLSANSPRRAHAGLWDRLRHALPGNALLPKPEDYDTFTPAVPLPQNRHTWHDDGLPTFHSILRSKLAPIQPGSANEAALVRAALKNTYVELQRRYGAANSIDYNRIGDAMDKFLADHGVRGL